MISRCKKYVFEIRGGSAEPVFARLPSSEFRLKVLKTLKKYQRQRPGKSPVFVVV